MKFIAKEPSAAELAIAERIAAELKADKQVVWLTSGGSNVELEVHIMDNLRENAATMLQNLTILPIDERYGDPGHENSNAELMRRSGFLAGNANWIDILAHDVSFAETIEYYDDVVSEAIALAHVVVGQFGLGVDGHVAGILPGSPACDEDYATVVGYEWSDYVRLTLSPHALSQINVAYVPAYGSSKGDALRRLQLNEETVVDLPARLLYEIPEVYVYNDSITSEG
jgi:6-phosphogluconolactonase/glucosamine-6-phosphate isomerase/deaminase